MGSKTIRFDEFDERVGQYWHPSDFDWTAVSAEVAGIGEGWRGEGFLRLVFDDGTQVLTAIHHRVGTGYQNVWETADDPAAALAAARLRALPATFADMWQTWNGWEDYLRYAAERYTSENPNFLVAVAEYRQAPGIPAQLAVYERFVVEGAAEQINIDGSVRSAIEERADGGADVFDDAEQAVLHLVEQDFGNFRAWFARQVAG